MKKIQKLLRENLNATAPDHLDELLAEAERSPAPRKVPFYRTAGFRVSVGGLAAALIALGIFSGTIRPLLHLGANPESPSSDRTITHSKGEEPPRSVESYLSGMEESNSIPIDPDKSAEGGFSGELYPVTVTSSVPLPDGQSFNLYSFERDDALGRGLLDYLSETFGISFDRTKSLSCYDDRPGESDSEIILWGNLDEGMFYYQHIIDYAPDAPIPPDVADTTLAEAYRLARELAPYIGETVLVESWSSELSPETHIKDYTYRFEQKNAQSIDNCETVARFTICFDPYGTVQTMRSDISPNARYLYETVTFGDDLLARFTSENGQSEQPNTVFRITDWELFYNQTIGLGDHGIAAPILKIHYTVNGKDTSEAWLLSDWS